MGCVFEHTTTELSERLKDTLKPLLSDPSSKLSKKLQTETKIKIIQNKCEDKISFSGAFSAILLANDIILAHLEQIKQQINAFFSQQLTFPPLGNKNSDVISHTLYHTVSDSAADNAFGFDHVDVHLVTEAVEHCQNEQSKDDGSSQFEKSAQNMGLTNIFDKKLSSQNANTHASSSSTIFKIKPLALPETFQKQITEQSDTCKVNDNNTPEAVKDTKDDNAEIGYENSLSSFGHHRSINLECNKRLTDEIIPKNHKKQKKINNSSEKEINIDETDIQHVQCSDRSNRTSHYSLRNSKPSSWVKKVLNLESIDADVGKTEDEKQESDPGYNPDQQSDEEEHDSNVESDTDDGDETDYGDEEHEKVREYQPSHQTINSDKDEEQLPNVEKKRDQFGKNTENEKEQVAGIEHVEISVNDFEEHCNKEQTAAKFCNSDKHKENEKKTKKKSFHKNINVDEIMDVVDKNDLEEPVFYQKKKIGRCVRDKKDPSVAESRCNLCTYVNSANYEMTKKYLKSHFSRNHFERELKFDCEHCGKKFGTKGDLHLHSLFHMYKKCEECGKMTQRRTFHLHARRHDPAYNLYKFKCDICNRKFTTKTSLKNHIEAIHNAEKRESFTCDICGKALASKATLKSHKSFVHAKNRNHLCDICGKAFQTAEKVRTHQQKHSEVPQYVCSICLKACRWKEGLRSHMKTHSEEREFTCPESECGKAFKQLGSLKRHNLKHTGERPFECNLCKKTFNDASILRRHKIGKHKAKK